MATDGQNLVYHLGQSLPFGIQLQELGAVVSSQGGDDIPICATVILQKLLDGLIRKILYFVRFLAGTNPVGEDPIRRIEPDDGMECARPFRVGVFPPAREATI